MITSFRTGTFVLKAVSNSTGRRLQSSVASVCTRKVGPFGGLRKNYSPLRIAGGGAILGGSSRLYASSSSSDEEVKLQPPVAKKVDHDVWFGAPVESASGADATKGDHPMKQRKLIKDPYFWLRDDKRGNEEVLSHLRKENEYALAMTSHLEKARKELYDEMLSHVKETDSSAGYLDGPYTYYSRTVEGLGYTIHCRRPRGVPESAEAEEIILDENVIAERNEKSSQTSIDDVETSPSHKLLAYTVDETGFETYELRFKSLENGEELVEEAVKEVDSTVVWGSDDSVVYYRKMDDQNRPFQVWRHFLHSEKEDEMLYEEADGLFNVDIDKTLDEKFLLIETGSTETDEVWTIDLEEENAMPKLVAKRRFGTEKVLSLA